MKKQKKQFKGIPIREVKKGIKTAVKKLKEFEERKAAAGKGVARERARRLKLQQEKID